MRDGRAKGVRALTGFGRNSLLSSLVVSANVLFLRLRLAKAGRSVWRVSPRESAEVKEIRETQSKDLVLNRHRETTIRV